MGHTSRLHKHSGPHWGEDLRGSGWTGWPQVGLGSPHWDGQTSLYRSTALLKGVIKKLEVWFLLLLQNTVQCIAWGKSCSAFLSEHLYFGHLNDFDININLFLILNSKQYLHFVLHLKLSWLCFACLKFRKITQTLYLNLLYMVYFHRFFSLDLQSV